MKEKFVTSLNVGDSVDDVFLVIEKSLHRYQRPNARGEEEFLRLVLGDNTGTISAVMWQRAQEGYKNCGESPLVQIIGQVTTYREQLQLTVESLQPVEKQRVNLADFQRASERDQVVAFTMGLFIFLRGRFKNIMCKLVALKLFFRVMKAYRDDKF